MMGMPLPVIIKGVVGNNLPSLNGYFPACSPGCPRMRDITGLLKVRLPRSRRVRFESPQRLRELRAARFDRQGPRLLASGGDVVAGARDHLVQGGWLLVEVAPPQAEAVSNACTAAGLEDPVILRDLARQPRVVASSRGG